MVNYKLGAVFDLDGVLLDSESNLNWLERALRRTLEHFKITPSTKNIMKIHSKNIFNFKIVSKELDLDPKEFWKVRNDYYIYEKINSMENVEIMPYPDVESLYCLKKKYDIHIISNSPQEVVDFFINGYKFHDLFNFGIGRGSKYIDLLRLKPNIFMYQKLKKKVFNDNFVYIGDTENDRVFANISDMDFIMVSRNNKTDGFDNLYKIVDYLLN
jgi:phosphoglycolate phosphatase